MCDARHRDSVEGVLVQVVEHAMATLVAERGIVALTMSQIAERAGIGRATLYKYFPDAHAVLTAWHERQITTHLDQIAAADDPADPALVRLQAVLRTYARIQHHSAAHYGGELATLLHRDEHVDRARRRLRDFIQDLLAEAARAGEVRDDVPADELADYCLHALTAAGAAPGHDAIHRLVAVTLGGLRP